MSKGVEKSSSVDKELLRLERDEMEARAACDHWVGRAHPNSRVVLELKAKHVAAMNKLISYRRDNGMPVDRVVLKGRAPKPADPIDDLDLSDVEGVVEYESTHVVKGMRGQSREVPVED